jgi:methylenetetrahydrofolate reductase (NADH)
VSRDGSGGGRFEAALASARPVVTCEIGTGDGADPDDLRRRLRLVQDHVDAVNLPDNTAGVAHLSALAAAAIVAREGVDPILHMTCRDRNRLALQSDLLGASALGIRNVLCLTGDGVGHGDHPEAKPVFDLDSIQLLGVVAHMTSAGRFLSGREMKPPPDLFPGTTENPFAPPYDFRPLRLGKKIEAGARFVQTQIIYNVQRFAEFMSRVRDLGLDRKAPILAGVAPFRSARAARYMRDHIPGLEVPDDCVRRMEAAGEARARREDEGIRICVEVIERLKEVPGLAGFHLMPIHWEEAVAEICARARLAPALSAPGPTATRVHAGGASGPPRRDPREQTA